MQLQAEALATRTVVSRELLEDAPNVDDELARAFANQFALTVDYAALYQIEPETFRLRLGEEK